MRLTLCILTSAIALGSLSVLSGCSFPASIPLSNTNTYSITVSPQPAIVPVGSTVVFTATTNAPANQVNWFTPGSAYADTGTPMTSLGVTSITYTAPARPPVYPGNLPTPGVVTLNTVAGTTTVTTAFTITAPSITTGISAPSNTTGTLALGATLIVYGYAVGSKNNAITAQVNGVTGGSSAYGTIALVPQGIYGEYTYTAPATMPMTGSTVTLTVISQADPTKSSTLTLSLH